MEKQIEPEREMTSTAAENHQFDFWLGEWDLSWGDGQTGSNRVTSILDGRVIQENFNGQPAMSMNGISLSVYDSSLRKWRQTWVDIEGTYIDLSGEYKDDQMVLLTQRQVGETTVQYRMVFYNLSTSRFDWNWERSTDGNNWAIAWQIHYQRK